MVFDASSAYERTYSTFIDLCAYLLIDLHSPARCAAMIAMIQHIGVRYIPNGRMRDDSVPVMHEEEIGCSLAPLAEYLFLDCLNLLRGSVLATWIVTRQVPPVDATPLVLGVLKGIGMANGIKLLLELGFCNCRCLGDELLVGLHFFFPFNTSDV